MDEKTRKNDLIEFFFKQLHFLGDPNSCDMEQFECELNGWEGLIVWAPNGLFYQMNYRSDSVWHVAMWPNDIYGKKIWDSEDHEWVDKED